MADSPISLLPIASALTGNEVIPITQGGNTVRVSLSDLAQWVKVAETIVPANLPFRGARVKLTADFSPPSSSFHIVSFGDEDYDTDSIWSLAQPTRLVVPTGVSRVVTSAYVRSPSGAANRYAYIKKNGAYVQGIGGVGDPATTFDLTLVSSVIDVVPGDYFELEVWGTTSPIGAGLSGVVGLGTWFAMEVKEYT
jgi:hypothetical protein